MRKRRLEYEAYIKQAEEKLKETPLHGFPVATDTDELVVNDYLLKRQKEAASELDDTQLNMLMDEMIESVQDKRALLRSLRRGELP